MNLSNSFNDIEDVIYANDVERLPSVQPKVKTGYWIDTKHYKSYDDGDIITTLLMCSNCKEITEWNTESSHKPYYCENCGAKMLDKKVGKKNELS